MKKIIGLIYSFVLLFACVFVSACGDKYKNLQFEISYSFSADADSWQNANDGIILNYGDEDDLLVFDANKKASLFVKVKVKNVKEKYLDSIVVQPGTGNGLSFEGVSISHNQIFEIPIDVSSSGYVRTTLSFIENNSRRSKTINFGIYESLKSIDIISDLTPAIVAGNSLNLSSLENFSYNPIVTNETGVSYSVESVGAYDDNGNFSSVDMLNKVVLDGTILRVDESFEVSQTCNVIKIKITSNVNEDIYNYFDLFVVKSRTAPQIKFAGGDGSINNGGVLNDGGTMNLYFVDPEIGDSTYSSSIVRMSTSEIAEDPYFYGVNTSTGEKLKFETEIRVDGVECDFSNQVFIRNGLAVSRTSDGYYKISVVPFDLNADPVVTLSYKIKGIDFKNTSSLIYSKSFTVKRSVISSYITLNEENRKNEESFSSGVVYGSNNVKYWGTKFVVGVAPSDITKNVTLKIKADNLIISDSKGKGLTTNGGYYDVKAGSTIYVKFKPEESSDNVEYILKQEINYNGVKTNLDDIKVSQPVSRVVTANDLSFVKPVYDGATISDWADVSKIFLGTTESTSVYLKVDHSGTLDPSTIVVALDSRLKFETNNTSTSTLNLVGNSVYSVGGEYSVYKIQVKASQNGLKNILISASAGNGTLNVDDNVFAETVITMSGAALEGLDVSSSSTYAKKVGLEIFDKQNFAIIKNSLIEFEVKDGDGRTDTINKVTLSDVDVSGLDSNKFSNSALDYNEIASNMFSVRGTGQNKTQVLKMKVLYYAVQVDGTVQLVSSEKVVQFAVYEHIGTVIAQSEKEEICYVNQYYPTENIDNMTYRTYTTGDGTPASDVSLIVNSMGGVTTVSGASKIKISTENDLNAHSVKVFLGEVDITSDVQNGGYISSELNGNIRIEKTSRDGIDGNITFVFTALRFGDESNVFDSSTVKIVSVAIPQKVVVSGVGDGEIKLSHMKLNEIKNVDAKEFEAYVAFDENSDLIKFGEMTYRIYEYEVDAQGKIKQDAYGNDIYDVPKNNKSRLMVEIVGGKVKVSTQKYEESVKNSGGLFRVEVCAKASYMNGNFETYSYVNVAVGDGTEKYAYHLASKDDFNYVKNDLSAYYILDKDIDLGEIEETIGWVGVGGGIEAFTGGLKSEENQENSKFILSYSITNSNTKSNVVTSSEYGMTGGLFASIGKHAKIENIDFKVTLNGIENKESGLAFGALAGENLGTINNVSLEISNSSTLNFTGPTTENKTIHFGALVGVNKGIISIDTVNAIKGISITNNSNAGSYRSHIGLVAGTNSGTISGSYLGKSSLESLKYGVVANLNVTGSSTDLKVGAVAGDNSATDNSATVQNFAVSGKISVSGSGYLGGIVGGTAGNVSTSIALGLDLTSESEDLKIGGLVGNMTSGTLSHSKFVSIKVSFNSSFETVGQIENKNGTVAGLVAAATGTIESPSIESSSVESFITKLDGDTFYTLKGNNVCGLAGGSVTINNSFVLANIDATSSATTTSEGSETNTYFIGRVSDETVTLAYKGAYSVVYTDKKMCVNGSEQNLNSYITFESVTDVTSDNFATLVAEYGALFVSSDRATFTLAEGYQEENKDKYYKVKEFNKPSWQNDSESLVTADYIQVKDMTEEKFQSLAEKLFTFDGTNYASVGAEATFDGTTDYYIKNWQLSHDKNYVELSTYKGIKFFFPYLVDEYGQPLMIIRPTDIQASLAQDWITAHGSIYVDEYQNDTYNITETVIMNFYYFDSIGKELQNKVNTYKLKELLKFTISPEDATGGVQFEIVDGFGCASIDQANQTITFTGISGTTAIIVKCYSAFNTELVKYVAFYTQAGILDLELIGETLTKHNNEYYLNLYSGMSGTSIRVDAYNGKSPENDEVEYDSLLDSYEFDEYLSLEVSSTDIAGKISISGKESLRNFVININNNIVTEEITGTIEVALKLSLGYFGGNSESYITIKTAKINVVILGSATNITSNITSQKDQSKSQFIVESKLETGFIGESGSNMNSELEKLGNSMVEKSNSKDGIIVEIKSDERYSTEEINKLLTQANSEDIVDLFNFNVGWTKNDDYGYDYVISYSLKDDYRYFENDINLILVVTAKSNPNVSEKIYFTITPSELTTLRMENYPVNKITVNASNLTNLVEQSQIESSIIAPGGKGSIMMLYMEPSFANVKSALLKSSTINVPSLGQVSLKFSQFVYNENQNKFETLQSSTSGMQGDSLVLQKKTIKKTLADGSIEYDYTGILYVHVQLQRFSGFEASISATLTVETNDGKIRTKTKTLVTSYLPGASLIYDSNREMQDGYLVQENSYSNVAKLKVYGYQFNSNPTIKMGWDLKSGSDYFYTNTNCDSFTLKDETEFKNKLTELKVSGLWYIKGNNIDGYKAYFTETYEIGNISYYNPTDYREIYKISDDSEKHLIGDYVNYYIKKGYKDVEYNPADDSYTMDVYFDVGNGIPASFTLGASLTLLTKDGQLMTSEDESLKFYPIDFVINSATISGLSSGIFKTPIQRNTDFVIKFTTDVDHNNMDATIFAKLIEAIKDKLGASATDAQIENALRSMFSIVRNGEKITLDKDDVTEFKITYKDNTLSIVSNNKFDGQVYFSANYSYNINSNGKVTTEFNYPGNADNKKLEFDFKLYVYANTTDLNAIEIETAADMFDENGKSLLAEGETYVLMNDIVVENIIPIDVNIASFDGNNRKITIKSFNTSASGNYGLFARLGTYTNDGGEKIESLLKNVVVDYSICEDLVLTKTDLTAFTFGGLVAKNEGGLIYNCDVLNSAAGTQKGINIFVDVNDKIVFGGLVGTNSGIITNSRVGRDSFTKYTAKTYQVVSMGNLRFVIGNQSEDNSANKFDSVVGGFVGENSGSIASSFVANTSIINASSSEKNNMTAGFVAKNEGNISYSYVKADSRNNSTSGYSTGKSVESLGNGVVAGFVYENSGIVENSFANIELKTDSAYLAGFVYSNLAGAKISESYSACKMNSTDTSYAEQPFVGKTNAGEVLSYGELKNAYYLIKNSEQSLPNLDGKPQAVGLDLANFKIAESLNGFVFILSNSSDEREQGIWSYYNGSGNSVTLPELANANVIAHSYRYKTGTNQSDSKYTYSALCELGSKANPEIIRDVDGFNNIFYNPDLTIKENGVDKVIYSGGYVRFIKDIDFSANNIEVKTKTNFILGEKRADNALTTSVDGNGMKITGVHFGVGDVVYDEIGLFGKITNATVKNLTIEFAESSQFNTAKVKASGGLAGRINNSAIINIKLNGSSTTLSGANFVGGLAGIITGSTLIHGIESNLSVLTNLTDSTELLYYSPDDYTGIDYVSYQERLSYAGGIAGVIDTTPKGQTKHNIAYVTVNGDEMKKRETNGVQQANISANFAGGIAGYVGPKTESLKVKYFTGKEDLISGKIAAGGLYAVSFGDLTACQVTADEGINAKSSDTNNQFFFDTNLNKYIISVENSSSIPDLDYTKIGNVNLIESERYSGGLVALSIGGNINSSYAKVGFKNGANVGGLIGTSVSTSIDYSYAIPFVNITNQLEYVGGLVGTAHSYKTNASTSSTIRGYAQLAEKYDEDNSETTSAEFTYSTLLLDNKELKKYAGSATFDFLCAKFKEGPAVMFKSDTNELLNYVFAGKIEYKETEKIKLGLDGRCTTLLHTDLVDKTQSTSEVKFQEVFSGWSVSKYWSLNSDRYYPLLIDLVAENYIIIDSADDFRKLEAYPDANFKIVDDIDMSSYTTNTNWIFNVEFTGVLIGQKDDGSRPAVTGLTLSSTPYAGETAGLFRKTSNATISNVEFKWKMLSVSNNLDIVAGFTCDDEDSLISNVIITTSESESFVQSEAGKGNRIKGFGGVVGTGNKTNIFDCEVKLPTIKVDLLDGGFFGGLIADAKKEGDATDLGSMAILDCVVHNGIDKKDVHIPTTFEISAEGKVDVGGAIGRASNAAVSQVNVFAEFNLTLTNNQSMTSNIGGVVGHASQTPIDQSSVDIKMKDIKNGEVVYIGGVAGQFDGKDPSSNPVSISNSLVKLEISNDSSKPFKTINFGGAVGKAGKEVEISKSVFSGKAEIVGNNIYGGGVVASSENIILKEIHSDVELSLKVNSEKGKLVAGGMIGSSSEQILIEASVTSGRMNLACDDANTNLELELAVGGMIGSANEIQIIDSYSATSILSDQMKGRALNDLYTENKQINALIGKFSSIKDENKFEVYYSTDIALVPENNLIGTNVLAEEIYNGSINLDSNYWTKSSSSATNEAYRLIALESKLAEANIITYPSGSKWYKYTEGSALNPERISADCEFSSVENEPFTYYLIEDENVNLIGNLKGILIGSNNSYTGNISISEVTLGSAVSNVHLKFAKEAEYDGFVKTNNGVVFNCSVQGEQGKVSEETLGLIVTTNTGLVSHSYSSAEFAEATSVGGIVHTNSGRIISCYFTGYIENTGNSAGIVVKNNDAGSDKNLIYNCYMAGVVTKIGESSFVHTSSKLNFSNCYVDKWTTKKLETEISEISSVDTISLVQHSGLKGNWLSSWTNLGTADEPNWQIDTNSTYFAYNYRYPMHKFGRDNDVNFNLNTGNGTHLTASTSLEGRYCDVVNDVDSSGDYKTALKISNLGQLRTIANLDKVDLNYVIIYDVGKDSGAEWTELVDVELEFNGMILSNKFISNTCVSGPGAGAKTGSPVTIYSLGQGLFEEIKDAYFAEINFANGETNFAVDGAGILGGMATGDVAVNALKIGEDGANVNIETSGTSGTLFGTIKSEGTIIIKNSLIYSQLMNKQDENVNSRPVGGIAGTLTKGTILFGDNMIAIDEPDPTRTIHVSFAGKFDLAGGVVGQMESDTIIHGSSLMQTISVSTGNGAIVTLGGIAGKYDSAAAATVSNVPGYTPQPIENMKVQFADTITVQALGGIVGDVQAEITIKNCAVEALKQVQFDNSNKRIFGLIAGNQKEEATITAEGFSSTATQISITKNSSLTDLTGLTYSSENHGVGGFVGVQSANLTIYLNGDLTLTLTSDVISNLGGIAGYHHTGGTATINDKTAKITLIGNTNVGGHYGYSKEYSDTTVVLSGQNGHSDGTLTTSIEVNYRGTEPNKTGSNIGGLVGHAYGLSVRDGLTNNTTIEIDSNVNVSNVGGIAGLLEFEPDSGDVSLSNLTNSADITAKMFGNVENGYILSHDGSTIYSKAMNVGGIFGKITGAPVELSGLTNSATVQGYQNVGGLVGLGYVDDDKAFTIKGSETVTDPGTDPTPVATPVAGTGSVVENNKVSGTISGVINVGGAVGYLKNGTIQNVSIGDEVVVNGNSNVGALVGAVVGKDDEGEKTTVDSNEIGVEIGAAAAVVSEPAAGGAEPKATKVNAVYYRFTDESVSPAKYRVYIPTNVGGLAGSIKASTIKNNTLNVEITSANEELQGLDSKNNEESGVISTVRNWMFHLSIVNQNSYTVLIEEPNSTTNFDEIATGFGGFAGSIDLDSMHRSEGEPPENNIETNTIQSLSINAQLGVNVGTFYGMVDVREFAPEDDKENFLRLPKLKEGTTSKPYEVCVDGAYNIGGIVGYVYTGGVDVNFNNISSDILQDGTEGINKQIILQSNITGFYVGGLVGKIDAKSTLKMTLRNDSINPESADGVKTNVTIQINLKNCYYAGGLVGKLKVIPNGNEFKFTGVVIDNNKLEKLASSDDEGKASEESANYGGFIGLLKVGSRASGVNVVVEAGKYFETDENPRNHNSYFTINTIENENYITGDALFDTEELNNAVYLTAQADYTNLDTFDINGSDIAIDGNPIMGYTGSGWAKEYTGFRIMQRCISKSQNNGAEWDSIAVVYDAANILNVKSEDFEYYAKGKGVKILEMTITSAPSAEPIQYVKWDINGKEGNCAVFEHEGELYFNEHHFDYNSGNAADRPDTTYKEEKSIKLERGEPKIIYTIYQEEDGQPTLYTKIGVATLSQKILKNSGRSIPTIQVPKQGGGTETKDGKQGIDYWAIGDEDIGYDYYVEAGMNDENVKKVFTEPQDTADGPPGWWQQLLHIKTASISYIKMSDDKNSFGTTYGIDELCNFNRENQYTAKNGVVTYDKYKQTELAEHNFVYLAYGVSNFPLNDDIPDKYDGEPSELIVYSNIANDGKAWFVFSELFDPNYQSATGSLFDVTGMRTKDSVEKHYKPNDGWSGWEIAGAVLAIVGLIALAIAALLTGGTALALGWAAYAGFGSSLGLTILFTGLALVSIGGIAGIIILLATNISAQWIGASFAKELYLTQTGIETGMLSSQYTREILFETVDGRTVVSNTTENLIQGSSGDWYDYYSDIRPSDYYSAYYTIMGPFDLREATMEVTMNEDIANNCSFSTISYTESISGTITIKDNAETIEKTYDCYKDKDNNYYAVVAKTYEYYQGGYYRMTMSQQAEPVRIQNFVKNDNLQNGYCQKIDNNWYVHGYLTDLGYQIGLDGEKSAYDGNTLTYNGSVYKANGKTITLNGIATKEHLNRYKELRGVINPSIEVLGYTYFNGLFYSPFGTMNKAGGRVAKYALPSTSAPTGKVEGVDYVKVTFVDDNGNETPRYYTLQGFAETLAGNDYHAGGISIDLNTVPNEVFINVYPDSFISGNDRLKDNLIYVYDEAGEYSEKVTYYYYACHYYIFGDKYYFPEISTDGLTPLQIEAYNNAGYKTFDNWLCLPRNYVIDNGLLTSYKVNRENKNNQIFEYNKFLSNKNVGLYTRYDYNSDLSLAWPDTELNIFKVDGENVIWEVSYSKNGKGKGYQVISYNGKQTYFTESLQLHFGGGISVK